MGNLQSEPKYDDLMLLYEKWRDTEDKFKWLNMEEYESLSNIRKQKLVTKVAETIHRIKKKHNIGIERCQNEALLAVNKAVDLLPKKWIQSVQNARNLVCLVYTYT